MGLFDKAKIWLGIIDEEDLEGEEDAPRAALRINPRNKDGRPPLDQVEAPPQHSLEEALEAREAGDLVAMRKLLEEMDRGRGLRTVLRAAAALEADDEALLKKLLPKVRATEPRWKLPLQIASIQSPSSPLRQRHRERAEALGAPAWAIAWSRLDGADEVARRRALVELLFLDPPLARTIAARDLEIEGAEADSEAIQRHTQFSHGCACIRRFGVEPVAALYALVDPEVGC
ncbi:MAG: hypothetical protein KC731_34835 [Myxococcales bacterium]|nr:hypothetical protein [Myxococcales bacterium]